MGKGFNPEESQTDEINIEFRNIIKGGDRVKVHFWDFGGQEIMHTTHQFFLSKRSLYLLILDARKLNKRQMIDWTEFRHEPLTSPKIRKQITKLAEQIADAIERIP